MMPIGMWVVVGWMAFVTLTGIVLLLYAWQSGTFKNVEEPKYRMLEDHEPEPWPDRKRRKRGDSK